MDVFSFDSYSLCRPLVSQSTELVAVFIVISTMSIYGYGGESGLSDLPESATVSEIQRTNILPSAPPPPGYENNQNNTGSEALGPLNGTVIDAATIVDRTRSRKIWRRRYAKLLVVGDAGLGKTTLIRTLLSNPAHKLQLHDGSETSIEQFRRDPDSLCSRIWWGDEEDRVEWHYAIQDTPGYGDSENIWHNIRSMIDFVVWQNRRWFDIETQRNRPPDLSAIEDPRIDVCLFCLPPHRLRYTDVLFMYELGKVVPILPVVTKADTMNIREATIYRQEVHNILRDVAPFGLKGGVRVFEFKKETLERAGLEPGMHFKTCPFLAVASNEVNLVLSNEGKLWPERQYPWGICEAFNPDHSDLLHLRLLLLNEGLEEISAAKLERYEIWRRHQLSVMRFGWNMKVLVLALTGIWAFGIGKSVANGKPPVQILQDAVRTIWKRINVFSRFQRKQTHIPLTFPSGNQGNQNRMLG